MDNFLGSMPNCFLKESCECQMPSLIQHEYYNSILIFITYNSNIHYLLIFIVFNLKCICKCFNNYNFGRDKGLIYKRDTFIIDMKYIPPYL